MTDLLEGLTPTQGGFIIRQTDEYVIEVNRMLFNWRLLVAYTEYYGRVYEHGYCYFGTGPETLTRAVLAGQAWENPLVSDPIGYDKKAF